MSPGRAQRAAGAPAKKRVRKQAVVVIHGIGEQQPMDTLRNLVYTLVGERHYSKPDRMTGSHELRRLRAMTPLDLGDRWLETDFYELYWAHEIRDTRLASVLLWLGRLYVQPTLPGHVHRRRIRLFKLAATVLALVALAAAMLVWQYRQVLLHIPLIGGLLVLVGILGIPTIVGVLFKPVVDVVGDAARYLSPKPENVQARQAIREAGIALLAQLHTDPNVDRVVIIGHSLGSIIGYDLLCRYWADVHVHIPVPKATLDRTTTLGARLVAAELERAAAGNHDAARTAERDQAFEDYHRGQEQAFEECLDYARKPRQLLSAAKPMRRWLISDFVTLGSPLAYMDFLRARTPEAHERAVALWEAPTSPPEPKWDWDEVTGDYRRTRLRRQDAPQQHGSYGYKNTGDRRYRWHHAAVFALTRWTNLYYPGDIFGASVAPLFGPGVQDQRLQPEPGELGHAWQAWPRWPWRVGSHVRYWHAQHRPPLRAGARWLREIVFQRAGADAPAPSTAPVRPVNRSTARYDELPEHLRS